MLANFTPSKIYAGKIFSESANNNFRLIALMHTHFESTFYESKLVSNDLLHVSFGLSWKVTVLSNSRTKIWPKKWKQQLVITKMSHQTPKQGHTN